MTNLLALFKQKYHFFILSLLTGILIGTSYIPFPPWALLFCYLPLWYSALQADEESLSLKFIFCLAWISQFILSVIGFNWIFYTAKEFGQLPFIISLSALFLFALFANLYIPLSIVFSVWIKRKLKLSKSRTIFLIALTMSLFERAWPGIFEWNLGYTLLWVNWPWFQWADTVGFLGLSTVIFLIQALFMICFFDKKKSIYILPFLILFLSVTYYFGGQKKTIWSKTDQSVKFMIVQGNIGNEQKIASEKGGYFQSFVIHKYIEITNQFLQNKKTTDSSYHPDIIIWPETAIPVALDQPFMNKPLQKLFLDAVKAWDTHVITGGYSMDLNKKDILGYPIVRNAVFFFNPNGETVAPYFKSELLAFGEYMPLGEQFPFLYKLLPFVGTFEKGPGPVGKYIPLKNNEPIVLGPQICYESLNPAFSRGLSNKDANIIFNLTNDSWFGDWAEPFQHMTMTVARAIEVRRPLVRSTNTGISTVILANGQMLEKSKSDTEWVGSFDVNYLKDAPQSFYTRYGHLDWILILVCCLGLLWKGQRKK